MQACVRLDDGVCLGRFVVEHGLRQGCVFASFLFNIFFAVVINAVYTRFKANKENMDALVYLRKQMGARGAGGATARELALATTLRGVLDADDARVVTESHKQLRKMVDVMVVVCATFGLAVSEANTEIMCLGTKGMPEATATCRVEAAGQVYNQTNEFVYEGDVNYNIDLPIEVDRRLRNAWCSFRKYTLELYDRSSAPFKLKIQMLRADILETVLYGCIAWSPRAWHY